MGKGINQILQKSLETKLEFSDDTKTGLFLANFNVKDYTYILINSTANNTETFDELLALLRRRLPRNNNIDTANGVPNANLAQYNPPTNNQTKVYQVT